MKSLDGYFAIQLPDIQPDTKLEFDLYLYLSHSNRMILYRKSGQSLDVEKIKKFKELNLQTLFIKEEHKKEYFEFAAKSINHIVIEDEVPDEKRIETLRKEHLGFLDDMFAEDKPIDIEVGKSMARELVKTIVNQIDKTSVAERYAFLETLISQNEELSDHLFNVSTFAVLFAFGLGHFGQDQVMLLSMSGLFHGVGLRTIDEKIMFSYLSGAPLSLSEKNKLNQHVKNGIQILKKRAGLMPPGVLSIVNQQLENYDGTGVPNGISGEDIHEFSRILRIAIDFNILGSQKKTKASLAEVLRKMLFAQKYSKQKVYDEVLLENIMSYLNITRKDVLETDADSLFEAEEG